MDESNRFISKLLSFIKSMSVARAVSLSFSLAILVGSLVLFLLEGGKLSYINAFYISASAFCVTGLTPVLISTLSFPGQLALMFFIQAGGLGIIVFTVLIGVMVIRGLSRNTKLQEFMFEVLDTDPTDELRTPDDSIGQPKVLRIIVAIFNIAITIELIGAFVLYFTFPDELPANVQSRFFLALFTSISAFNNAGFSITDDISFLMYNLPSLYAIMFLILMGGIGFPVIIFIEKLMLKTLNEITSKFEVWCETHLMIKAISGEEPSPIYFFLTRLSFWTENQIATYNKSLLGESSRVQTTVILIGSFVLICIGTITVFLSEYTNEKSIGALPLDVKFANSLFVSIASRTAGFNTFDMSKLMDSSIVVICSLMFIGGGPQGTAGGIKITTFVIFLQYLKNVINSQSKVQIFGQLVSKRSVAMSIRLYFLATTTLMGAIFILSIVHPKSLLQSNQLTEIVFEVISAFGTVGFTLNFTPKITDLEKVIYSLLMYLGRIGIFTVLVAVTGNSVTSQMGEVDDGLKIQVG
ncbi:MAG: potassium transporter Trk [Leptospiraceae bacterium]|nr:potassium transporter Trk [Leptospiraceae bacterium]MBK7053717.1 potassium transporter Trk [Leptospiraceae bacterium]MBK9500158.1 potassium transporter Trk [Leptospiraceae bacterium]MBL0264291.1 potassium transporter Trk [Leptospiraceae bacterium]MBP9163039.1 potassium transporter Trk [Leptospiraceae bacterium]